MLFIRILFFGFSLIFSTQINASSLLNELYINPIHQNRPIAIIFNNSLNPCQNCNKAIYIIYQILKKNYYNQIHLYLIDLAKHPEFIPVFNLQGPLNLVIIRISDKASFGYQKLSGLQSKIYDINSLTNQIEYIFAIFLNIRPQN